MTKKAFYWIRMSYTAYTTSVLYLPMTTGRLSRIEQDLATIYTFVTLFEFSSDKFDSRIRRSHLLATFSKVLPSSVSLYRKWKCWVCRAVPLTVKKCAYVAHAARRRCRNSKVGRGLVTKLEGNPRHDWRNRSCPFFPFHGDEIVT